MVHGHGQIVSMAAYPLKTALGNQELIIDLLARLYDTIPEAHDVPTCLYIEANDAVKADYLFVAAQVFAEGVRAGKIKTRFRCPGVTYFSTLAKSKTGETPVLETRSAEVQAFTSGGAVRENVGICTTHTNKVASMRRLKSFLEKGLIRFHVNFHTVLVPGITSDAEAVRAIFKKFITQFYNMEVTRSPSGNEIFSGKEHGNDDLVMATGFALACVAMFVTG